MHDRESSTPVANLPPGPDLSGPPDAITGKGRPRRKRRGKAAPVVPAPDWRGVDPNDLSNPALYINRELSWLAFNQRVLDQARDPSHPLLERVKFLAIVGAEPRRVLHGARGDAAEEAARRASTTCRPTA